MNVLIWKSVLVLMITFACVRSCPPHELPEPCNCINAYGQLFVRCVGLKDYHELERSLKEMADYGIARLQIVDSKLKHIPYEPFLNMSITRIVVVNTNLFYLFDMPLSGVGASTLIGLSLQNVWFDGGLDWTTLEYAKNLTNLAILQTNLEQLPESFSYIALPNLRTLLFEDDSIEYMSGQVFSKFEKLETLTLKKNMLKKFERGMLPHPTGIRFIDLSYNLLESFSKDIFDDMPMLNSLLLDGNRFVTLQKSYMENLFGQLFYFSVENNPLTCDCELSWLLQPQRPFHLLGHCTEQSTHLNKELENLGVEDFKGCNL